MTTSVISHSEIDPNGNQVPSYPVNIRLTTASGQTGGFRLADGTGISSIYPLTASAAGSWSVALERSTGITPGGSFYVAEMQIGSTAGGTREVPFVVGTSNQTLYQALLSAIPSYVPPTSVPPTILTGNNLFTGINNFRGDVHFGNGCPWFDVKEEQFGAVGNGVADDTAAIQAAITAAEGTPRAIVYIPPGVYLVSSTLVTSYPVTIMGAGGLSEMYNTVPFVREAASVITTVSNITVLHLDDVLKGGGTVCRDFAITGNQTGASQNGIFVDNRIQPQFERVAVIGMGNAGWLVGDCVAGYFVGCQSSKNIDVGWDLNPALGSHASPAVTNTQFNSCSATQNGSDGWLVKTGCAGLDWNTSLSQTNGGFGWSFVGGAGASFIRGCGGDGNWDEVNTSGAVSFDTNNCRSNVLGFDKVSSNPVVTYGGASVRLNGVKVKTSLSVDPNFASDSLPVEKMPRHLGGAVTSADMDHVAARLGDNTGDGHYRARSFVSTFGTAMGPIDPTSDSSTPQAADAVCIPNNRGVTWRNAADSANLRAVAVSTNDNLDLGSGLALGKTVKLYASPEVTSALVFSTANAGAALLPATALTYIDVVLPNSTHGRIAVFST